MPYKSHRSCPICFTVIKDLSSHLRQQHGLSVQQRSKYLVKASSDIPKKHGSILSYHSKISPETDKLSHDYTRNMNEDEIVENNQIDSDRVLDYLFLLKQFHVLKLTAKRDYIRKRAPDSFIFILRECVANVRKRIVQSNGMNPKCEFNCNRICDGNVTNKCARNMLGEIRMIEVLSKIVPDVINYLKNTI